MRAIKTNLKSSVAFAPSNDAGTTDENVAARSTLKASANNVLSRAKAFAAKMADDEDGTALVERYLEAKIDVAMGPQWFFKLLKATYTDEELAATPIPGTKMETKDEQGVVTKHNNPDEYDAPKADGSVGTVSRFWSWDVADELPAGKLIAADLQRAAALMATNEGEAKDIERNATKRRNNLRGLVQRGISLWHQVHAIEAYENVTFAFDQKRVPVYEQDDEGNIKTDANGNYVQRMVKSKKPGGAMVPEFQWVDARTETPCIISNAEKDEEGKVPFKRKALSIVQFLSLDVAAATEKGGSYDDLLATARRETEENEEPDYPSIQKVGQLGDVLARVSEYVDNDDNYNTLKRALAKRSEGNDQLAATIEGIVQMLQAALASVPETVAKGRKQAMQQAA